MEPNVTLKELRQIADRVIRHTDSESMDPSDVNTAMRLAEDAAALAERVQALDEWLKKGGFLPTAWSGKRDKEQAVCDAADKWLDKRHDPYAVETSILRDAVIDLRGVK